MELVYAENLDDESDGNECVLPSLAEMAARVFSFVDPHEKNTPLDLEGDIKDQVNMTRLRCCVRDNTITAEDLYLFTRFRKRNEDTILLRAILFGMYCDMSASSSNNALAEKYLTDAEKVWKPTAFTLPPFALRLDAMKETMPNPAELGFAMQQLVDLGKVIRFRRNEHPHHDLLADAEMYFHHFDYARRVLKDVRLVESLKAPPSELPKEELPHMEAFLIRLMESVHLDSQNFLLRKMWYENYITPLDVEKNQFDIGPGDYLKAQRVFSIMESDKMNTINRILSTPIELLTTRRKDSVRETCLVIELCTWVSNHTAKRFAPSVYTLHDARSASTWSFIFMFRRFFFVAPGTKYVGPFKTAKDAMWWWASMMKTMAQTSDEESVAEAIFERKYMKFFSADEIDTGKGTFFTDTKKTKKAK